MDTQKDSDTLRTYSRFDSDFEHMELNRDTKSSNDDNNNKKSHPSGE